MTTASVFFFFFFFLSFSILAWKIPWTEEPRGAIVHGVAIFIYQLQFHVPADIDFG